MEYLEIEHGIKKLEDIKISLGIPLDYKQTKEVINIMDKINKMMPKINMRNGGNIGLKKKYDEIKSSLICTGSINEYITALDNSM
jgi:hypothetical protein